MRLAFIRTHWYKVVIVGCWLPFIALCYYNQPYLDDYWTGRMGRDNGIWATQGFLFFNWTGRFASTFSCVAFNPLSYVWPTGVKLTALMNIGVKIGLLWMALRSLTHAHLTRKEAFWLASGLALTYVCLVPDKYATLYSFTDWAVYQLPAASLVVVPMAIHRIHRATAPASRRKWQAAAVVATVAAAAGNEMNLILTGWVLLVGLSVSVVRRQRESVWIWGSLLTVLLLAGSIAVLAPGNYERLKSYASPPNLSPVFIAQRLLLSLKYIFTDASTLLTFALPLLLAPLGVRLLPGRPAGFRLPLGMGALLVVAGTVLGALPYSILPQPFERPLNVLEWWMLLAWMAACWASLPESRPPVLPAAIRHLVAVGLALAVGINTTRAWAELLVNGPSYQQQWQARYTALAAARAQGKKSVDMLPITNIQPYHTLIRGYDNQPDFKNIRNVNLAKWYGLDSVRTTPRLMHLALY